MDTLKKWLRRTALTLLYIGGLGYSALLDIVMAVFIMHFLNYFFFGFELVWYHYFFTAPIIGMLLDITSVILQLVTQEKVDDAHHDIHFDWRFVPYIFLAPFIAGIFLILINMSMHQLGIPTPIPIQKNILFMGVAFMSLAPFAHLPLIMIPAGFILGTLLFSPFWGLVIAVSFFLHLIHDSSGLDFGLKWLWPFTNNQYHFGGRLAIGKKIQPLPFKFVHTLRPEEIDPHQYMDVLEWVREVYLKPTHYQCYELYISATLVFVIAMTLTEFLSIVVALSFMIGCLLLGIILPLASMFYELKRGNL